MVEHAIDMPLAARVFASLADGAFHSGEELAASLGVTRSSIWKATASLRELGVPMQAVRNRGYCLRSASAPLDVKQIRAHLSAAVRHRIDHLDVHWHIDSTNTALVSRANPGIGHSEVLLAEFQSAGRGRRGRQWLAPPGGAICLSLSWTFPQMPRDVGALSLAIGVCVLHALEAHGLESAQLKWPNDVLVADRKLGGILIELRAEAAGPASAVIGIGLNFALADEILEQIATLGLPATDLRSQLAVTPSRNAVAASLIDHCIQGLTQFESAGLQPFIEHWSAADALQGRDIDVRGGDVNVRGVARGIDLTGALLVETPQGLQKFFSGDVSVRPAA